VNNSKRPRSSDDLLDWIPRIANKLNSLWLCWTYPFASVGRDIFAHWSCQITRSVARQIKIGKSVEIDREVRLDVPRNRRQGEPAILLDDGCVLGRFTRILAINKIHVGRDTIFGPSVLVTDHVSEAVSSVTSCQNSADGGTVHIEEECWLGFGSTIVCTEGELTIGHHSVIGANCVVKRSIPPYSVIAGTPARIVKQYDLSQEKWVLGSIGDLMAVEKSD
jgi:acetyltransferase-like isoleucine patch superfamily enzyme